MAEIFLPDVVIKDNESYGHFEFLGPLTKMPRVFLNALAQSGDISTIEEAGHMYYSLSDIERALSKRRENVLQ